MSRTIIIAIAAALLLGGCGSIQTGPTKQEVYAWGLPQLKAARQAEREACMRHEIEQSTWTYEDCQRAAWNRQDISDKIRAYRQSWIDAQSGGVGGAPSPTQRVILQVE